ncbi:sugar fermentation stimulation protein SfsA [Alphaproteobacteria bacterium 46_93_T64]|nr:sugar fermentation stimulation protein SfsA [Alphaproteobacteria bacterium 46_93_T64]
MKFPTPLIQGTLIKRYKRFLSDVTLENGEVVVAHCANSGSMMGLKEEGFKVWLSISDNPKRKLKYSWELVDTGTALAGINTAHPNKIVADCITDGRIPELTGYDTLKREVKYGKNSRIDIFLQSENKPDCYVEVKNVTLLREEGLAEFPDSVTARGTKHLQELSDMVAEGHRAVMFYLVQRDDCTSFKVASDIDPTYAEALKKARAAGVEIFCYDCKISPQEIEVQKPVQFLE